MELTTLEIILAALLMLCAITSFLYGQRTGYDIGINEGAESLVDILVEEKLVSRYYDKDGTIQLCESGSAIVECPKCGFHDGDNCNEV